MMKDSDLKNKNNLNLSLTHPEILFLSFFGVGFIKYAPGTMGTLATLPFLFLLGHFNPPVIFFIPLLAVSTLFSCFIADRVQKQFDLHDPSWIVIDEVLGMATAWLFITKHNILHLVVLFLFFRFFDIIKFWPASYFDKKVSHGAGTILDDIISGAFSGLAYLSLVHFSII